MKPALLLIDFQRDFCAEGGYAHKFSGDISWSKNIIPKVKIFLNFARREEWLIIHTREGYAPDLFDCHPQKLSRSKYAGATIGSEGPLGKLLIRGEYGHDIVDELKPKEHELVLDKAGYGAFFHTDLDNILKDNNINELYFSGVTADVCVHTTLREAVERGYICYYLRDLIASPSPSLSKACEEMVEMEGGIWGTLTTSQEAIKTRSE